MSALERFFPDARLTELGKIKIGGKSAQVRTSAGGNKWRAPEKHDYFTITTMNRSADGDLVPDTATMEQLKGQFGDPDGKLRQIPIYVLSNDIDDILQVAYLWYGGKSVAARSDGLKVTWFYDRTNGRRLAAPIEEDWKPEFLELKNSKGQNLFKKHSVFNCVMGAQEARFGGVYKFRTTSVITSQQLYQSLVLLSQHTGGILTGLPLMLVVRPVQVSPEGKTTTVYVVHVEMRGQDILAIQDRALRIAQHQLANRQTIISVQSQYRALLAPPGTESDAEAADIAEEFQPETADDLPPPPALDDTWAGVLEGKQPEPAKAKEPDKGLSDAVIGEVLQSMANDTSLPPITDSDNTQDDDVLLY